MEARVDLVPELFREGKEYLRVRKLPVNELADTVMVVKLEFDEFPGVRS